MRKNIVNSFLTFVLEKYSNHGLRLNPKDENCINSFLAHWLLHAARDARVYIERKKRTRRNGVSKHINVLRFEI